MKHAILVSILVAIAAPVVADDSLRFTRKEDVIYGRKHGMALTLDVVTPAEPNGLGVIWIVSGGWFSDHAAVRPEFVREILKRGYTVFAVVHGSQPKYTIPEVVEDLHRAVRFVRLHAKGYGIDPARLGVTGGSAGGHLSLMLGTGARPGDPNAKDPVDRETSRVQAVACFYPPTDFLNYGKPGEIAIGRGILKDFRAPFDFHDFDRETKHFVPITDEARVLDLGRQISPANHASADDAPALIIHGDADKLVPIQQAEVMVEKLKAAGAVAKLVVKPGAGHGWPDLQKDMALLADWFDEHLRAKTSAREKAE